MTQDRLKLEYDAMATVFSPSQFEFFTDKLVCVVKTCSNRQYTIQVDLTGNYPEKEPKVFIVSPKPLLTHDGQTMLDANPAMRTLAGENGCVQVCHYKSADWHPNLSLYQVITRVRIWIEIYEAHLKTGHPIAYYLDNKKLQTETE